MSLKMKQLMEETGESKSTILFYVKEGLLPEPSKPKPNLHLYDESSVNIIKFIKYMQHQFSYSIAQIKAIFSENTFDFSSDFSMLLKSLQMMSGEFGAKWYEEEDFLELSELSQKELDSYLDKGWIFKQEQGFSTQELKLVQLFKDATYLGLDDRLFDAYVKSARSLAKIEYELGSMMLDREKKEHEDSEHYKILFDSILILKPYLFNMHTIKEHQKRMEKK
ncbi:MAG: MerR family transcriptional regulator [Sulfurovum sp.]|nr:MAG: MerR family transcriptional regulator [Sulfurovum sp.]